MGLWGDVKSEGSVDQGVSEGIVPVEGGQGRGGEYVSGGGISLEVVEMVADDLLDVDIGEMVGKDKEHHVAFVEGKRGDEGQIVRDGSDPAEGPVSNGAGESSVEDKGGHFGGSFVEVGLARTYATESEEQGKWNRVFTGSRVPGCIIQVTVGVGGFIMDIGGQSIPRNRNRDVEEREGGIRDTR
eukprot:g26113.t1